MKYRTVWVPAVLGVLLLDAHLSLVWECTSPASWELIRMQTIRLSSRSAYVGMIDTLKCEEHCLGDHLCQTLHFTNGGKGNRVPTSWQNSYPKTKLPHRKPGDHIYWFPGLWLFHYFMLLCHENKLLWVSFPERIQIVIFPLHRGCFQAVGWKMGLWMITSCLEKGQRLLS